MKSEPKKCPGCGAPIPESAPQGLCPKCLMAGAAMATETGTIPERRGHRPAPSLEEIANAFPQLQIVELIGRGGMGFVYRARQPKLDRDVALKILPQHLAEDAKFAERFAREGRLLAKLNHPNIVSVYDFGEAGGFFYLLMEFVDGVNLRQAMRASQFTPAQALSIVPAICEALQFAHDEGVLHRDIKPENILLDTKGRVKIADFGIAKLMERGSTSRSAAGSKRDIKTTGGNAGQPEEIASITGVSSTLGTPQYMAPEQIEHPSEIDHRADIYSLGVVFYELLTGELPKGEFARPSAKTPLDERVDQIVQRALEKEREHRQQSARELKTEVETVTRKPAEEKSSTVVFDRTTAIAFAAVLYFLGLLIALPVVNMSTAKAEGTMFVLFAWGVAVGSFVQRKYERAKREQTGGEHQTLLLWFGNLWMLGAAACLPVCGFGVFFAVNLIDEFSGGHPHWNPAPSEALTVPIAFLGMLVLPWATIHLWKISETLVSPRSKQSEWQISSSHSPHAPRSRWPGWSLVGAGVLAIMFVILFQNFLHVDFGAALFLGITYGLVLGLSLGAIIDVVSYFRNRPSSANPDFESVGGLPGWARRVAWVCLCIGVCSLLGSLTDFLGSLPGVRIVHLTFGPLLTLTAAALLTRNPSWRKQALTLYLSLFAFLTSTLVANLAGVLLGVFNVNPLIGQSASTGIWNSIETEAFVVALWTLLHPSVRSFFSMRSKVRTTLIWSRPLLLLVAGTLLLPALWGASLLALRKFVDDQHSRMELQDLQPVVVETTPISGARDVAPGEAKIQVRFSKAMLDESWSWSSAWEDSTPEMLEMPHYNSVYKTCSLRVKLEPDKTYAYWLNSENFKNFQDTGGRPAVPYLLIFHTQSETTNR